MSPEYQSLEDEITEMKQHQKMWIDDFRAYYKAENTENFGFVPHVRIKERAESLIRVGLNQVDPEDPYSMGDVNPHERRMIFLAIGAESLLNSIMLKEDWQSYFELVDFKDGRTPSLSGCRGWLMPNLPETLQTEERKRVYQVLEILRLYRNNSLHLGYSRITHVSHLREIYKVLSFLLDYYYDSSEVAEVLSERVIEIYGSKPNAALDYPPVDFGIR